MAPPDLDRHTDDVSGFVPRPGARVGRFRIESGLARGGQGVVLRARDAAGRPAAIKLLLESSEGHPDRFRQEGSLLQRLRHPGLPEALDRGEFGVRRRGTASA